MFTTRLISQGRVTRGSIGVSFQEELGTNSITLKSLGAANGVVIEGVEPGSPAEKAGLKGGDVITSVNGQPVKIRKRSGESDCASADWQQGENRVTCAIAKRKRPPPSSKTARAFSRARLSKQSDSQSDNGAAEYGLRVENLTPERASRIGLEGHERRVGCGRRSGQFR